MRLALRNGSTKSDGTGVVWEGNFRHIGLKVEMIALVWIQHRNTNVKRIRQSGTGNVKLDRLDVVSRNVNRLRRVGTTRTENAESDALRPGWDFEMC